MRNPRLMQGCLVRNYRHFVLHLRFLLYGISRNGYLLLGYPCADNNTPNKRDLATPRVLPRAPMRGSLTRPQYLGLVEAGLLKTFHEQKSSVSENGKAKGRAQRELNREAEEHFSLSDMRAALARLRGLGMSRGRVVVVTFSKDHWFSCAHPVIECVQLPLQPSKGEKDGQPLTFTLPISRHLFVVPPALQACVLAQISTMQSAARREPRKT